MMLVLSILLLLSSSRRSYWIVEEEKVTASILLGLMAFPKNLCSQEWEEKLAGVVDEEFTVLRNAITSSGWYMRPVRGEMLAWGGGGGEGEGEGVHEVGVSL
jgi:hypothetical protein